MDHHPDDLNDIEYNELMRGTSTLFQWQKGPSMKHLMHMKPSAFVCGRPTTWASCSNDGFDEMSGTHPLYMGEGEDQKKKKAQELDKTLNAMAALHLRCAKESINLSVSKPEHFMEVNY